MNEFDLHKNQENQENQDAPREENRRCEGGRRGGCHSFGPGMRPLRPDMPPCPPHFLPEEGRGTAALLHGCGRFLGYRLGVMRGKMGVLAILAHTPEMSQRELQERLRVQPGSMSEMLAKMEEQGLIQRTKDESDRRAMQVSLTEEGKKAFQQREMIPDTDLFSVLTEEERETLNGLLKKLLDHWVQAYGRPPRPMHGPMGPMGPMHGCHRGPRHPGEGKPESHPRPEK